MKLKKIILLLLGAIGSLVVAGYLSNFSPQNLLVIFIWLSLAFSFLFHIKDLINFIKKFTFWQTILSSIKIAIFIACTIFLIIRIPQQLGYTINLNLSRVKGTKDNNSSSENKKPTTSPQEQVITACQKEGGTFCSNFSNIEKDFEGIDFFSKDPLNPKILRTNLPIKGDKDNAILWIKEPNFTPEFYFSITSKFYDKEKGNLTIVYGNDWRCIIGENNFNTITCESFYSNTVKKDRKSQHLSFKKLKAIQPETELLTRGSTTVIDNNKLKITLSIEYFDIDNNKQTATFDFETKYLSTNPKEDKRRFGVGIIDPLDEGISIEFMKVEIKGGI